MITIEVQKGLTTVLKILVSIAIHILITMPIIGEILVMTINSEEIDLPEEENIILEEIIADLQKEVQIQKNHKIRVVL